MVTSKIREKFYGRFVQNAPLSETSNFRLLFMTSGKSVHYPFLYFFLYDNYCILFSVFLLLVLFIFSASSPLSLCLALLAGFSLAFALLKKRKKIIPVMQVMFCLENCTHFCV